MNPIGMLALGALGGILLENPEKRKKVIASISKITKSAESIVKEVMPNVVSTTTETLQATTGGCE